MMWKKEILLEDQNRSMITMKILVTTEEIIYVEEGGRDIAVVVELTDNYHGNYDCDLDGDDNDDDEGGLISKRKGIHMASGDYNDERERMRGVSEEKKKEKKKKRRVGGMAGMGMIGVGRGRGGLGCWRGKGMTTTMQMTQGKRITVMGRKGEA